MRKLRNILLTLLSVFFIVVLAGILLARIFEQQVTSYIIKEVNKNLTTEISISEVNLSLLKKFPDASVIFNEVLIKSANPEADPFMPDTLLFAEQVFLNFNIIDLIRSDYSLNDLQFSNGVINIFISRNGKENYQFWSGNNTVSDESLKIELELVRFSDVRFFMENQATQTILDIYSRKSSMTGSFTAENFKLKAQIQGQINSYSRDGLRYIDNKALRVDVSVIRQQQNFAVTTEKLQIGSINLHTEGELNTQHESSVDLKITGSQIAIPSFMDYFPMLKKKIPSGMEYDGEFDMMLSVTGVVSKTSMPHLEAVYSIDKASIDYMEKGIRISGINVSGIYSNGDRNRSESSVIYMDQISAILNNSRISGKFRMLDFRMPGIECYINGKIKLENIQDLLPGNANRFLGYADTELFISGRNLSDFKFTRDDFSRLRYKGTVIVRNLNLIREENTEVLKDINANIIIDKHLIVNDLNGYMFNNNLHLSGRIDNWYEYFIDGSGTLWTDLNVYSDKFILDSALVLMSSDTGRVERKDEDMEEVQTAKLHIKLNFWFDEFRFQSVAAGDVRGELIYEPGLLKVNHVAGNTMMGSASSQATIEFYDDKAFSVLSSSRINGIDIKEVFTSFNNFSQEFIQDKHLEGKVSGSVDFYGEFNSFMKLDMKTFLVDAELNIKEGELIGFEPMEQLSRFIDVEELQHIHFSELKNEIFIRNGEVVIPQMDIYSSAMNLSGSGIHSFDNYYNYKIRLSLSEVLAKKMRRKRNTENEFGIVEETRQGRLNVYLSIDGTPEGTEISYNRKAAVTDLRQKMDEEKTSMKEIIRDEYGLFIKDSLIRRDTSVTERPDFIIEWDADSTLQHTKDSLNNWKNEKFIIEFEEDTIDSDLLFN